MIYYYAFCDIHGKVGEEYGENIPNAKNHAWEDCSKHKTNGAGCSGQVRPKVASRTVLPNGKKRYKYSLLKEADNPNNTTSKSTAFAARKQENVFKPANTDLHLYGNSKVCLTDSKGYAMPKNMSPAEIVLDASEGFIPLWAENVNLRWRFNRNSLLYFENPQLAKDAIRELFSEAILKWDYAAPIKFSEREDAWDFEISVRHSDNCSSYGCTLASAFFPDAGRHELVIYPKMFTQSRKEQVDTLIHEIGHIFGLRHFFADIEEREWPSEIYGKHNPFSIMNYGNKSELTEDDKSDLSELYKKVWNGELKNINGTPIVLVKPYHQLA